MQLSEILAPWEYDGNAPPEVMSHLRADGCLIALLADEKRYRRIVCRVDGDDGSWTVAGGGRLHLPFFAPAFHGASYNPSPWFLLQGVEAARSTGRLCRVMFAREGERVWRSCVAPSGMGACQIGQDKQLTAPFTHFFLARETQEWSSSQTHEHLTNEAHNPDSSLSFALRFHLAPHVEKMRQLFGFATHAMFVRAQSELDGLARYVLRREASLWPSHEPLLWSLRMKLGNDLQGRGRSYPYESLPPSLGWWENTLRRFGPLQPQTSNVTLEQFWSSPLALTKVLVDAPSAHEQIEAHLALREWASGHLPPDVRAEMEERGF